MHHLLAALALMPDPPPALVVGFGTFREWLEALALALAERDEEALAFLDERMDLGVPPRELVAAAGPAVTFTGRLDHRYAGPAAAALDVLVVPSILEEAFGMAALEGAAAGALPLVARHSGLAEVAGALEEELGHPGLLSFEPGSPRALAAALERLLSLPDRAELAARLSAHVRERWGWRRTADLLLEALR